MTTDHATIEDAASDMREDFAFLEDWEARYAHIIDLGKALEPLSDSEMNEANKVRGCASQVWLATTVERMSAHVC